MPNANNKEPVRPVFAPMSESLLLHMALNSRGLPMAPFLTLSVGQDTHSWGLRILAGDRKAGPGVQEVLRLTEARWRKDLLELSDVALLAQSALRKVSLERGWPIP